MSVELCLACFDALDAHLAHTEPYALDKLQSSYAAYLASLSAGKPPQDAALRRVAGNSSSSSSSSSSSTSLAASTAATSVVSSGENDIKSAPLFVTWNTLDGDDDDSEVSLRGCIGTFEDQDLAEGIPEYAIISAVQDHRFSPITRRELPTLQAAVTLLTDFEEVDDAYDWVVGVHGIRLSFHDKGRRFSSTYLPDVASEQGWTKEEALYSLVRKAGWMGSKGKFKDLDLKVTRYQGKKATADYAEYKQWKDWAAEQQ